MHKGHLKCTWWKTAGLDCSLMGGTNWIAPWIAAGIVCSLWWMARTESHHEKLLESIVAFGGWHELNRTMKSCWNRLQPGRWHELNRTMKSCWNWLQPYGKLLELIAALWKAAGIDCSLMESCWNWLQPLVDGTNWIAPRKAAGIDCSLW